ncbi:MAG: hypothetical protein ABIP68_00490 [Ferruginibacter sp.]
MTDFEVEKNRKAFIYTVIICAILLLLSILISWKNAPPPTPVTEEFYELNLGNDMAGWGETQPLIKGQRSPSQKAEVSSKQAISKSSSESNVKPDDYADKNAAVVNLPSKNKSKTKDDQINDANKTVNPKQPKVTYNGAGKGAGNNEHEDNGYKYQGNTSGAAGDNGSPEGNKDSYGNTPGGAIGGPKIIRGNRSITKSYSFTGDLNKATINAIIKVSPEGRGTFVGFDKGSTSRSDDYARAIRNYLANIQFSKASAESNVVVQFNFRIN